MKESLLGLALSIYLIICFLEFFRHLDLVKITEETMGRKSKPSEKIIAASVLSIFWPIFWFVIQPTMKRKIKKMKPKSPKEQFQEFKENVGDRLTPWIELSFIKGWASGAAHASCKQTHQEVIESVKETQDLFNEAILKCELEEYKSA